MGIDYRILVGHDLEADDRHHLQRIISYTFNEVDQIFNQWNPHSEISRLNKIKAGVIATISPQLEFLLETADKVVKISHGKFDPTVEPARQLWRSRLSLNQIPSPEEIDDVKRVVGWDKVHFHNGIFYKDEDLTALDMGGISKGLAVDLILDRIHQADYENIYVEWGGEIRTSGKHPEDRPWLVAISRFGETSADKALANLEMKDNAVATSGDYIQTWTLNTANGKITYHHIINPKTCEFMKVTSKNIASATFQANSCALADGLATAALIFDSIGEAESWAAEIKAQHPEISYWLVVRNGSK